MRQARHRWVLGSILGAACASGGVARAEPGDGYELGWERTEGAESCPDAGAFVGAVRERIGADPFAVASSRRLHVALSRSGAEWRSTLRASHDGVVEGSQELKSGGESCRTLFSATVAVAAVMLGDATRSVSPEPAQVTLGEEPKTARRPSPDDRELATSARRVSDPAVADRVERSVSAAEWSSRPFMLGLELVQDFGVISGRGGVCDPGSEAVRCYEADGSQFSGTPQPGVANRVSGGYLFGAQRVLLGVQHSLSDRFAVELRAGRAFGDLGPEFMPWHLEGGVRYFFARGSRLRGFVAASAGFAEFGARLQVTLRDCASAPDPAACAQGQSAAEGGTPKTLSAIELHGQLFAGARIGGLWSFAEQQALTLSLGGDFTFPVAGLVLEPAAGYAVEF